MAPCESDSQATFSRDGTKLVFVRTKLDASGFVGPSAITTMDLASGRVAELTPTAPDGGQAPSWSPDGTQIVFSRFGEKDSGGPVPPRLAAVWLIDANGQNLRQISPKTLAAQSAVWSPDGSRILFASPDDARMDIYTVRPDGSDVRRLTTDGVSIGATWTPDGRILFARGSSGASGEGALSFWTMDADGTNAAELAAAKALGATAESFQGMPAWQPAGGPATVALPWTPAPAIALGPPAPTPSPTPTPDLAAGFSWTGSTISTEDGPLGETATLLVDGRVLVSGGCSTSAEVYDPAAGTFSPTGTLTATRGGGTATRLQDGRVLLTGGYNCGKAGEDGIWASAELYDPASGTFSPTGSMTTPREFHTATLLTDGRVLITGGISGDSPRTAAVTLASYRTAETSSGVLATAEVYDPSTGTFSKTGSMSHIPR